MGEVIRYKSSPVMFRNKPVLFIAYCLFIPVFGLGLIPLILWWIQCLGTTLTVTDERVVLRKGILSKYTNDVMIQDIRNVQVGQSFFQRVFGVGSIGVSTSAQADLEIELSGIPDPEKLKAIINDSRAKFRRS